MSKHIFIIEDDPDLLALLKLMLSKEGFNISSFLSGEDMLKDMEVKKPDLILLDIMLPGINGLEICDRLKVNPETWNIPIIILTSRNYELDILHGINLGCDDYITKPFNEKILVAKIKAALKREDRKKGETDIVEYKDMFIDSGRFEVSIKSKIINLTPAEFKTLYFLVKNKGMVLSRDQIFENTRNNEDYIADRSIDILIGRIRKKLGQYGTYVESVYGVGYRFKED